MTLQIGDRVTISNAEAELGYIGKRERGTITGWNGRYFSVDWDSGHIVKTGWRPQDLELVSAVDRLARVLREPAA